MVSTFLLFKTLVSLHVQLLDSIILCSDRSINVVTCMKSSPPHCAQLTSSLFICCRLLCPRHNRKSHCWHSSPGRQMMVQFTLCKCIFGKLLHDCRLHLRNREWWTERQCTLADGSVPCFQAALSPPSRHVSTKCSSLLVGYESLEIQ